MKFVRTWIYYLIYPIVRLAFALTHPVLHVSGRENLPKGPYILCCNHSSWTDPFWVIFAVRPKMVFRFLAKRELETAPVIGFLMKQFGVIFVSRGHHDVPALSKAQQALLQGEQMMIFPEGTRVKPGAAAPAKPGAVQFSCACKVPVVPMYLTQNRRLFRPLRVVIGKPYYPAAGEDPQDRLAMKAHAQELLGRIYSMGEKQ